MEKVFIIGIAGGTGSGKTTLTQRITRRFPGEVAVLYHDSYYRDRPELSLKQRQQLNYDHPDSLETELLVRHLQQLREGQAVDCPVYDFAQYRRLPKTQRVEPRPVVLVEGILIFQHPELRSMFDLKVYVEADADIRVLRRLRRDILERGRTVDSVMQQYQSTVKPMHQLFVEPTRQLADIIVPSLADTSAAVELLVSRIESQLKA